MPDPRFTEDERFEPDPDVNPTTSPSFASQLYDMAFNAPKFITEPVGKFADYMSRPGLNTSVPSAMVQGFIGGAAEGAASQLSPANLLTMGRGRLPQLANKILGGAQVLHGGSEIAQGNIAEGMGDIAFGALDLHQGFGKPTIPKNTPEGMIKSKPIEAPITAESMPEGFFHKEPTLGTKKPEVPTLSKGLGKKASEPKRMELEAGVDYVDPFEKYRQVPVGTKYTVTPEKMSKRNMVDAIRLGFDVEGLDDKGRVVIRKIKESPKVQLPKLPEQQENLILDALNIPRTLMASLDMSAPLRQGVGLIHKKEFWNSLPSMFKAYGSEEFFQKAMKEITNDPIFVKPVNAKGQLMPSYAEKVGLALTDLKTLNSREESMMSKLAEKIPGVRASNRAYTLFLNKLRADTFKAMTASYKSFAGIDARNNIALGKDIATYINSASGRGPLPEKSAKYLSTIFFSPRLIASRLHMMGKVGQAAFSPSVYMSQAPNIRREYLKSLGAIASLASVFTGLGALAGGTVESDLASSDAGKLKIGNTRIDPYGGFQQPIVLMQRLMPDLEPYTGIKFGGRMKSTTTGIEYDLEEPSYGQSDKADVALRFLRSKTNPIANFAWGLLAASKELSGKPMEFSNPNPFENSIAQRFVPMMLQDMYDLYNDEETPAQAKVLAQMMATFGMGSQTYGNRTGGQ